MPSYTARKEGLKEADDTPPGPYNPTITEEKLKAEPKRQEQPPNPKPRTDWRALIRRRRTRVPVRGSLLLSLTLLVSLAAGPVRAWTGAAAGLSLSPVAGPPTSSFTATGTGFGSGEKVRFEFDATAIGSAVANPSGTVSKSLMVPASAPPGLHQVSAVGHATGRTAAAPFTVRTNWTQYRFGAPGNPYNPYENVLGPSNVAALTSAWGTSGSSSIVAVDSGLVFTLSTTTNQVSALDAQTGGAVWTAALANAPYQLAAYGGLVFVSVSPADDAAPDLVVLHEADGTIAWRRRFGGIVSDGPIVANGLVVLVTDSTAVHALDLSGRALWTHTEPGTSFSYPTATARAVFLDGYFPQKVVALDRKTGSLLWATELSAAFGPPVVGDPNSVYVSNYGITKLDAATGAVIWTSAPPGEDMFAGIPTVAGGRVYFQAKDYHFAFVTSIDATTGAYGGFGWDNPYEQGDPALSDPVVANGLVYVGVSDGDPEGIYAIDIQTRQAVWASPPTTQAQPIVVNGTVYSDVQAFVLPGDP